MTRTVLCDAPAPNSSKIEPSGSGTKSWSPPNGVALVSTAPSPTSTTARPGALATDGAGAARALGLLERVDDGVRARDLVVARREQRVERRDLRGMDRPLAVEAHVARALGGSREALVDRDAEVRPVDRGEVVRARREEDLILDREPGVQRCRGARRPADRRRQVGVAEDQRI